MLYHLCSYIRIFYTQCGSPSTSVSCWSKDFKRAECSCIAPKPPPAPSGPIIGGYGDFRYQYMPNLLQLPEGTEVTPRGKNHDYSLTRSLGIVIFLTHPRTHAPTHPRTHAHTHAHTPLDTACTWTRSRFIRTNLSDVRQLEQRHSNKRHRHALSCALGP